jgi:hypothetical protein
VATTVFLNRVTIINLREITLALESRKSTLPSHRNDTSVDRVGQDDKVIFYASSDD